jgi:ABC-2 type transport system ATP-binding protein
MSDEVIRVSNLTKRYEDFLAVDNIGFSVRKGEIFGFLGPNGAGKTTTIRMLTGLSEPTGGEATILGSDAGSTEVKRMIGVVPESSNLYDELSAMDNLLFMANLYGIPQRRERAEEMLKTFGLPERKRFGTFSKGMKRALTIAAALIHKPEILFLDEPTSGLDVVAAKSLRSLILKLREQGMTIFLTTHYLEEADLLCDRIAIIVKGKIVRIDAPEALKASVEEGSVIECSFSGDPSIPMISERLPGTRVERVNGNTVRIYGGDAGKIFEILPVMAKEMGVEITSLNTLRPSLEEAFIKITGLSPVIMAIEKGGENAQR